MHSTELRYRIGTVSDVPGMDLARGPDREAGPADPRMSRYLTGEHHPQKALASRIMFVAEDDSSIVGYIGGHETRRFGCDGELQYLYVVPRHRRRGVATELLTLLARWFVEGSLMRVCVGVDEDAAAARAFLAQHGATDSLPDPSFLEWLDIGQVIS